MDCVILDDGGFLLMANHDDYTNQVWTWSKGEVQFPVCFRGLKSVNPFRFLEIDELFNFCHKRNLQE